MSGNEAIALAFALTNALRLLSCAPQIWRVAWDRSGAQAISCLTWNLWIAANATTALYAWTHLHDVLLTAVNAGNAACCASVVLITLAKRAAHARATLAPTRSHWRLPSSAIGRCTTTSGLAASVSKKL